MVGCINASAARMPIYNKRQRLQSNSVTLFKINGVAIKAANTAAISTNTTLYLITYARGSDQRCLSETRKDTHDPTPLSLLLDRKEWRMNLIRGPQPDWTADQLQEGTRADGINSQSNIECILSA